MIVFNIPKSESPNSPLENSKRDFIQEVVGVKKIRKSEFNSMYRIGKTIKDRCRPVIIKLSDLAAKQRLLKLRNLIVINQRKENAVYIIPDRTASELLAFRNYEKN